MSEYLKGSAINAIVKIIKKGGIKNEFIVEIVEDLIEENTKKSINIELLKKKIKELESEVLENRNTINNFKKTITQTRGYDINCLNNDIVCQNNNHGESKINYEKCEENNIVESDRAKGDSIDNNNLTEDDKTILRENFTQEFGWDVPPNKKNDFSWIIEKIKNSKKYREEYRKRQKYRKNKQDNKRKNEIGGPWRP